MARIMKSGRPRTLEMELEALGGTFLVTCTPVMDDKGHLEKVIHIATDISQRKQMEEALHLQAQAEEYRELMVEADWKLAKKERVLQQHAIN